MSQLWDEVVVAAKEAGAVALDAQDLSRLVDAIYRRYLKSPASSWWWSSLKVPIGTLEYGDRDGLAIVMSILPEQDDLTLVVTNESVRPLGAVRGSAMQLRGVIANCPFFEFAIVPANLEWIVFDTHHNALVGAGRLEALASLDAPP